MPRSRIPDQTLFRCDGRYGSNSVMAVMSAARLLFHRKRKSIGDLAMSQECPERTHALQQTACYSITSSGIADTTAGFNPMA
jgi:hypothetical protein